MSVPTPDSNHADLQAEISELEEKLRRMRRMLAERTEEADQALGQLSSIIDSMTEGLLVVDSNNDVRIVNAPLLALFNAGNDVIGTPVGTHFSALANVVPLGRVVPWRGEVPLAGERVGAVTVGPMRDAVGKIVGVVLVVRDVSDARELERLKRDFVANISHELRTPLTTIAGFSALFPMQVQRLAADVSRSPEAQRKLRRIAESADVLGDATERLRVMVDTLVDFSTLQAGTLHIAPGSCDLAEVVSSAVGPVSARRRVPVIQELSLDEPVWADVVRTQQVVGHLLDNATKFCPDGEVSVQLFNDDGEAHLVVRDRGPGLPQDRPMRVFEAFWQVGDQLTAKPLGVGLGLPFCREVVAAQRGRMWAENRAGGGAEFHVILPLARS